MFDQQPENAIVAVSAMLPSVARATWNEKKQYTAAMEKITPGSESLLISVFEKVDREFDQYAMILQLPKPKKSLFDYINE